MKLNLFSSAMAAMCCLASLNAQADAVFSSAGIINGLATFSVTGLGSDETPEVEYLDPTTGEYVSQSVVKYGQTGYYLFGTSDSAPSLHFGDVICRARVAGSESEWTPLTYTTGDTLAGTIIYGDTTFPNGVKPAFAMDGKVSTMCEPVWSKKTEWIGMDFGEPHTITGCRIFPRSGWLRRLSNRVIEVSETPDFASSKVVCTIPNISQLRLYDLKFDKPVRARYIRLAPGGQTEIWNFTEISFQTDEHVPTLAFSVGMADIDNGDLRAKISWTPANAAYANANIYASSNIGGPWTLRATVATKTDSSWIDEAPSTAGDRTYYCITEISNDEEESAMSAPVAFVQSERLDKRTYAGALADGLTGFGMRIGRWAAPVSHAFDGSLSTFSEGLTTNSTGVVALGLDMGSDHVVTGSRLYPRGGWSSRVQNLYFWGTPASEDSSSASAKLNPSIVGSTTQGAYNSRTAGFVDVPCSRVYLYASTTGVAAFYGNITELQFYGYPVSALASQISTGESPMILQRADGLFVTWEPCAIATSYDLERRAIGGEWSVVYTGSAPSFLDTDVETDGIYQYRMKAVKDGAYGYSRLGECTFTGANNPISADWTEAFALGSGILGSATDNDGTLTLTAKGGDIGRYGEKGIWLHRAQRTGFVAECTATADAAAAANGQTLSLIVRAGEGEGEPFAAVSFRVMKSFDDIVSGAFAVRSRATLNADVTETTAWTTPVVDLTSAQLSLQQKGSEVKCWVRENAESEWTLLATIPFAAGTFGQKVQTGFLASTSTDANGKSTTWTVTDFTATPLPLASMILFR